MRLTYFLLGILIIQKGYAWDKVSIDSMHQKAYQLLDTNLDSALIIGEMAEKKAANEGLTFEEANSLFIQAYVYRNQDELGKAFIHYLKALELLNNLNSTEAKLVYVKILLNTGEILDRHFAYQLSMKYYDEGIGIALQYQFNTELLKFLHNKAEALRQRKELNDALRTVEEALDLAKLTNYDSRIPNLLNLKGLIQKDMGSYQNARNSYMEMIGSASKESANHKYLGRAWHNIAVTYMDESNYLEAEKAYLKAIREKELQESEISLFISWMDLAETYYLFGQHRKAYKASLSALELYEHVLVTPEHYYLFSLLSKITHSLETYNESHLYSRRFEEESAKFLKAQEDILKIKDQYKMEILTAGFFQEIEASETEKQYQLWLLLCAGFFTSLILIEKGRQYYIRRSIKIAIQRIEAETE